MDKRIASFFHGNSISFNVADSSSFARTIEESMRFAKQNTFQPLPAKHTGQLSNLQIRFLLLLKNLEQLEISEH